MLPPALWLVVLGLEALLGLGAVWLAGQHGPALIAVALNLFLVARFAMTLRPGRVPLITQYGRADPIGLPARCEFYTRGVTAAWAVLLAGFALVHAGAMLDLWHTADVALAQTIACTALFLAEHPLRSRLCPETGIATPWRTLRAVWLSIAAVPRHAG